VVAYPLLGGGPRAALVAVVTPVAGLVGLAAEAVAGQDGSVSWHVARSTAGKGGGRRGGPSAPRPAGAPHGAQWWPPVGNDGEQYMRGRPGRRGVGKTLSPLLGRPLSLGVPRASTHGAARANASRRKRTRPPCAW